MRTTYDHNDKKTVIKMHLKGLTLKEISQKTKYGFSFIQRVTTKYWENKMKKLN